MMKRIALAPKLETAAAAELRKSLVEAQDHDIVVDASAVEMIGALCVEILMSVAAVWSKHGRSVTIEDASPQMIDDLGILGLTTETLLEYAG